MDWSNMMRSILLAAVLLAIFAFFVTEREARAQTTSLRPCEQIAIAEYAKIARMLGGDPNDPRHAEERRTAIGAKCWSEDLGGVQ
jgi:high-affinity K+ transport system ATPase subunit B